MPKAGRSAFIASILLLWAGPDQAAPPLWGSDDGFKPFDILEAIRGHFRENLPRTWYINSPEKSDKGYKVTVGIPADWGGNPVGAADRLCPDRKSLIWQHIDHLTITPFYLKHTWAKVECR